MDADTLLDTGGEQLSPTCFHDRATTEMQRQIDARVAAWHSSSTGDGPDEGQPQEG